MRTVEVCLTLLALSRYALHMTTSRSPINIADPYDQRLADATPTPCVWFDHTSGVEGWVFRTTDDSGYDELMDWPLEANDPDDPDAAVAEAGDILVDYERERAEAE